MMVLLSEVEIILGLTGIDQLDVYKAFPTSWKGNYLISDGLFFFFIFVSLLFHSTFRLS